MKKESKESPGGESIDFSRQRRICRMVFCDKPRINPYIEDGEIIFFCDEYIPSGNGGK